MVVGEGLAELTEDAVAYVNDECQVSSSTLFVENENVLVIDAEPVKE